MEEEYGLHIMQVSKWTIRQVLSSGKLCEHIVSNAILTWSLWMLRNQKATRLTVTVERQCAPNAWKFEIQIVEKFRS